MTSRPRLAAHWIRQTSSSRSTANVFGDGSKDKRWGWVSGKGEGERRLISGLVLSPLIQGDALQGRTVGSIQPFELVKCSELRAATSSNKNHSWKLGTVTRHLTSRHWKGTEEEGGCFTLFLVRLSRLSVWAVPHFLTFCILLPAMRALLEPSSGAEANTKWVTYCLQLCAKQKSGATEKDRIISIITSTQPPQPWDQGSRFYMTLTRALPFWIVTPDTLMRLTW